MKKLMLIPVIGMMVLFSSCSEDGEGSTDLVQEFDLESETTIEANYDDVDEVVNAGLESGGSNAGRIVEDELLDGVTVTRDSANNMITIDFGDGVEGPGGRVRKGKIIITYEGRKWEPGSFRQVTFEEFFIDDVKVEGVRTHTNTAESRDDNPQFAITLSGGKLTFTDGTVASREVDKLRTWIRATNPLDDEVTMEGIASGARRDGVTYSMEILEPIVYKRDCRRARVFVPVAGVKQITSGENVMSIDYGDGTCDNIATVTVNGGEPEEITLNLKGRR